MEIICINDGSTDSSLSILQRFANRDKHIKIINQKKSSSVTYTQCRYFCRKR
ncbi:MAG: glycosyltransferase [Alphaproteobacteria bacterium]|nr:glycosyltransferase [Alphaproteobacteria bacterium]